MSMVTSMEGVVRVRTTPEALKNDAGGVEENYINRYFSMYSTSFSLSSLISSSGYDSFL